MNAPVPAPPSRLQPLESVAGNASDLVAVFDADCKFIYANPATTKLLGIPWEDLSGKSFTDLAPAEQSAAALQRQLTSVRRTGRCIRGEIALTIPGKEHTVLEYSISPVDPRPGHRGRSAIIAHDISERKASEAMVQHLAFFDSLTDLPNRINLEQELEQRLREAKGSSKLAIMIIDLDRFKNVNDTATHSVGDQVLSAVAERLRQSIRFSNGFIGRLSGDEFMFILPGASTGVASRWCRQLLASMEQPFVIGNQEFSLTATIGASVYPHGGADAATLFKNADIALYAAKAHGRNCFRLHTERLEKRASHALALENGLHRAVELKQFTVYYQPIIQCRTGRIGKAEALIRWEHPEFGLISPADFIPMSEESDDILKIGMWMLETVANQLRQWQDAGLSTPKIAVNLSPRQLNQFNLPELIAKLLQANSLSPHCLELEVTETTAIRESELVFHRLQELRRMGLRTAIDDFGSGYASLSYLKRLPIDTIKIDKQFVQDCATDPQDAAIIKAIIDLAHSLKLRTVAEGVEDSAQLAQLLSLDCDSVQGYLFSHPLPAGQFAELLRGGVQYADSLPSPP